MPSLNDRLNAADPTIRSSPPPQQPPMSRPVQGQLVPQQAQNLLAQMQQDQLVVMQMMGLLQQSLQQAMPDLNMVAGELMDQLRAEGNQWIVYEDEITITLEE